MAEPDPRAPDGAPRWVKVFAVAAVVFLLLFLAMHLAGGGLGGHGRHVAP